MKCYLRRSHDIIHNLLGKYQNAAEKKNLHEYLSSKKGKKKEFSVCDNKRTHTQENSKR